MRIFLERKHIIKYDDAGWSSLEARRAHNPKVIGSNPVPATRDNLSRYAQIAQLVEQRTENPRVTGSIPVLGIICASGSAVEHLLAKEGVAGSIPVSRSHEKMDLHIDSCLQ